MNLREVLDTLGIPTAPPDHHHNTQGWLSIDCPFCTPGARRFRLGISEDRLNANCFACGPHRLWETLSLASGSDIKAVAGVCAGLTRFALPDARQGPKTGGRVIPPARVGPLKPPHKMFLRNRGFDPEAVEELWGVGGIGLAAEYAWRLYIPIAHRGEVVSWTTRSLSDAHEGRYLSAPPRREKIHHKDVLYGWDYVTHTVIVQEGPLDVWAVGPGAVCTFGTGCTPRQVVQIATVPVRVILFDNEPAAQGRARKLVDELSVFPGETYCATFQTGKDASRAADWEVDELRKRFLP